MPQPQASGAPGEADASSRATFGQVFAVGEFRALWLAQILSVAGDQLARVALTLLVFDRTRSPLLASVTFAASVLPTFIGGLTLSGLADRLPRRQMMVGCDLVGALLVAVMVIPRMPVAALVVLLFLVTLVGAPFTSARAALYPDILRGDLYVVGTAVTLTTVQVAQVVGFATGGLAVVLVGVPAALVLDAATFVLSALITLAWVRRRPAAMRSSDRTGMLSASTVMMGIRLVFGERSLRTPMLLAWLAAFLDVYEGVAAPLARELGGGAEAVGLILAAGAFGAAGGAMVFSRFVAPARRIRLMSPLAIAACAVLIAFAGAPGFALSLLVLAASGALSAYLVAANAAFVAASPVEQRSQAFGIAQGGISLGQAIAMVLAGAAVRYASASDVIAGAGAVGVLLGVVISMAGARRLCQWRHAEV